MKSLLIIPKSQYGYNTDYYKMATYFAKKNIKVTILCFDQEYKKIEPEDNINVIYLELNKNKIINHMKYNFEIIKFIYEKRNTYNWVIISGTIEFCGFIPLVLKKFTPKITWLMDIRTCAVFKNEKKRWFYDNAIKWSAKFFDHITIISDLVAKRLNIKDFIVLPLGADKLVDITNKVFKKEEINLLYVGTFENRNIENVVKAYDNFCIKINPKIKTRFDIVGFSHSKNTQDVVLNSINAAKNKDSIIYHGRKTHDEIKVLFENATVGVSYIPKTDYFDVQPPTKTFEYIMNGIICLGTNTTANAQIINDINGILVEEDIDNIEEGILKIFNRLNIYKSNEISKTVESYTWGNIEERFLSSLLKITKNR
jgi:Glycosyl transferases group 1/Glycosyl transferase 4-like